MEAGSVGEKFMVRFNHETQRITVEHLHAALMPPWRVRHEKNVPDQTSCVYTTGNLSIQKQPQVHVGLVDNP